jgi:hypothetical protein
MRELKGFRELTVQPVIDRAVVLGEWGASDATRDEGSIGGVPAAGDLIGLPTDGCARLDHSIASFTRISSQRIRVMRGWRRASPREATPR